MDERVHALAAQELGEVRVDGGQVYAPALQLYKASGETIGTPSVRTGVNQDVYLTLERQPDPDGTTTITVRIVPFLIWLWIGAAVIAIGTMRTVMVVVPSGSGWRSSVRYTS